MNEFDYLAKAKKNMEKEKYHEVISLCDEALKINSDLPKAYDFRGNAKYELGQYDEAIHDFSQVIKREPNDAGHYYDRSWAYWNMDNVEDAIIDISKALEIEPKNSLYYYEKARFEYWSGRYKESIIDMTKGIELKPTENKYLIRGYCYLELEMYNEALENYNSAIDFDAECSVAYYRRGILYKKLEKLDLAEKDFKKAIELHPEYDDAMIELGFVRIQLGKKDAMKYFNKAVKVHPCTDTYYWKVKGRQNILIREDSLKKLSEGKLVQYGEDEIFNEKQAKDDINDLNKALALDSEDIYCLRLRAARYSYLEQDENALTDYENLAELEPENQNWALKVAYNKCYVGKYQESLDDIDNYLKSDNCCPDDIVYFMRGKANFELKNYKTAISDFTKGLAFKEDEDFYYNIGLANYKLKHFILAYKNFKKALEINPQVEVKKYYKIPLLIKMLLKKNKNNNKAIGLCQVKNE